MASEPPVVRLLREGLEDLVPAPVAAAALLEALARWGTRVPATSEDVTAMVRGPLEQSLRDRVGAARATAIVARLERALALAEAPTGSRDAIDAVTARFRVPSIVEVEPDHPASVLRESLDVLVIAATPHLTEQLSAAFGDDVAVASAHDRGHVRTALEAWRSPHIVIVDALDPAPIQPDTLARDLAALGTSLRVVWAREAPYGRQLLAALAAIHATVVSLRRKDGLPPLLDVVRSRRG